ncbi:MAG TPA: PA2779 family protein [Syntrophobacteria bacterium]|nr:PA2779 family protein [Syntrophobacteria bacterium]
MKAFMTDPAVRWIATMLIVVMGLVSFVPPVEASFVPSEQTDRASSPTSRQQDMATIQRALEQKLVQERLRDLGYTDEEIKARLDQLSDADVHSLAAQLDSLAPAGELGLVIGILVIIILVIVILMLTGHRVRVS